MSIMETILSLYILVATHQPASTYGYGEMMCGDVGAPRTCDVGAWTASGEPFSPPAPTAAVAAPFNLKLRARWVMLRVSPEYGGSGECQWIRINDKMNPRWVGRRGFDLTPGALRRLGVRPRRNWSGRVSMCPTHHLDPLP